MRRFYQITFSFVLTCLIASLVFAQETKSPSDQSEKPSESDKKDESKKNEVSVTGVFEAQEVAEVIIDAKEWTAFKASRIVDHGQQVQKGDILLTFESDKYKKAESDAEFALKTSELTLEDARLEMDIAKKNSKISLKAAVDADRKAARNLKEWVTEGKAQRMESADRSLTRAKHSLEYQEEELKQLEKMYKADDLTEETEEIILKRTRNSVDSARYSFELAKDANKRTKEISIPESEDALKTAVQQAAIALTQAQANTPRKLKQQEIKLKQQEIALEEQRAKLKRLRADRKFFEIRAPRDGIVYYGAANRGKWPALSTLAASMKVGGTIKTGAPVMSVVDVNSLKLRVSVPEASIRHLSKGSKCKVESIAYPDATLEGKVEFVSKIPISDGNFDCIIAVELGDLNGKLMPGMKGKATLSLE